MGLFDNPFKGKDEKDDDDDYDWRKDPDLWKKDADYEMRAQPNKDSEPDGLGGWDNGAGDKKGWW